MNTHIFDSLKFEVVASDLSEENNTPFKKMVSCLSRALNVPVLDLIQILFNSKSNELYKLMIYAEYSSQTQTSWFQDFKFDMTESFFPVLSTLTSISFHFKINMYILCDNFSLSFIQKYSKLIKIFSGAENSEPLILLLNKGNILDQMKSYNMNAAIFLFENSLNDHLIIDLPEIINNFSSAKLEFKAEAKKRRRDDHQIDTNKDDDDIESFKFFERKFSIDIFKFIKSLSPREYSNIPKEESTLHAETILKTIDEFVDKYLHQGANETFIDNEAYTNATKINFTESDYRFKN